MTFLSGIFLFSGPFLLSLLLQDLHGYAALDAGIILVPSFLTWLLLSPLAGRLYGHLDCRLLVGSSLGLFIGGYYALTRLSLDAGGVDLLPGLVLTGAGIALLNAIMTPAATATLPRPLVPTATSLLQLTRRVGGNVGYALIATLVLSRTALYRAQLIEHVSLYDSNAVFTLDGALERLVGTGMAETEAQASALHLLNGTVQKQAMMLAFNDIFWIMAILFVLGLPLLWLFGSRARPHTSPAPRSSLQVAGVPQAESKIVAN
jgi:DHA2 family multidrug resistance protein